MKNTLLITCGILVMVSLIGTTVFFGLNTMSAARADIPPPAVKTIADFRSWRPTFTTVHLITFGWSSNYYIDNDNARYSSRGPRTYVFNTSGKYLETSDLTSDMRSYRFASNQGVNITRVNINDIPIPE